MRRPAVLLTVILLQSSPALAQESSLPTWSLQPELRIGSVDDGEYALSNVSHILASPTTGAVFIAQPGEIRVFDGNGRYVRTIGRQGRGPGEFERLGGLGWARDGVIAAFSQFPHRLMLFTEDGQLLEDRGAEPDEGILFAAVEEGRYLGTGETERDAPSAPLILSSPNGNASVLDELVRSTMWTIDVDGLPVSGGRPLAGQSVVAVDPAGRTIAVVHQYPPERPDSASFRVRKLGADGSVSFARNYRFTPVLVPPGMEDTIVSTFAQQMPRRGAVPRLEERLREALQVPRFQPPITNVRVAVDGSMWLRREALGADRVRWLVLDLAGDPVGQLLLPRSQQIHHIDGDTVWGVELDALDVPYAVRYRIVR